MDARFYWVMRFQGRIVIRLWLACLCLFTHVALADKPVLKLYNWENYMPQAILDKFEAQSGIAVELVFYETDELKNELIFNDVNHGLDLVIGSDYSFSKYLRKGNILATIPENAIPNRVHIASDWYAKSPHLANYSVPFSWGSLGIIYRSDLVNNDFSSWLDLLEPNEILSGKIIMIDDMRDAMSAALLATGASLNSHSQNDIQDAAMLLRRQKPHVNDYRYISLDETSELISGEIIATMGYSGDAQILQEYMPSIRFSVPEEGTALWSDHIAVFESSKKKSAAFAFINFIHAPENAAFIAESLNIATANQGAYAFLSDAHKNNPIIYPPADILSKSEFYEHLPNRTQRMYNMSFVHAKH